MPVPGFILKGNAPRLMYREAFKKLELEERATILDQVNPRLEGTPFDPLQATVLSHDLDFYPGYQFLEIADHSGKPPMIRFALYKPGTEVVMLDFTNAPIYALNRKLPIKLNDSNVTDYARFFFTYVRGRHGRFIITEGVDDIQWKEEPPPAARKAISKMIEPVQLVEKSKDGKNYKLAARVMFKDSLFKTDIFVSHVGDVALADEELLIEDMPVMDDTFGQ